MKLCIFNGHPYHYEMFGFIIDFCLKYNYTIDIYTENKNSMQWLEWYKHFFKNINIYNISNFDINNLNYNGIFLTSSDDKKFLNTWYEKINIPIIYL